MIPKLVKATHPERPPWANWKATNPDGSVWYFEVKPRLVVNRYVTYNQGKKERLK